VRAWCVCAVRPRMRGCCSCAVHKSCFLCSSHLHAFEVHTLTYSCEPCGMHACSMLCRPQSDSLALLSASMCGIAACLEQPSQNACAALTERGAVLLIVWRVVRVLQQSTFWRSCRKVAGVFVDQASDSGVGERRFVACSRSSICCCGCAGQIVKGWLGEAGWLSHTHANHTALCACRLVGGCCTSICLPLSTWLLAGVNKAMVGGAATVAACVCA
jgi:hypothetical protein